MVVSFVNASLLTLAEAIGVILGAHIGTTVTAWLIAILGFKISMSAIALPLVGVGFSLSFSRKAGLKNWGRFIVGFALLFIGLQFLKESVPDIKANPEVLAFLQSYTSLGFLSVIIFFSDWNGADFDRSIIECDDGTDFGNVQRRLDTI